ncbi:MAG TPA: hypothetical protein VH392_06595 [Sphingomicrobium sp.]|jgi:hypothetical protein
MQIARVILSAFLMAGVATAANAKSASANNGKKAGVDKVRPVDALPVRDKKPPKKPLKGPPTVTACANASASPKCGLKTASPD